MHELRYFDQLQQILRQSGKLVMSYFGKDIVVRNKGNSSIVTNVDFENEQFLKKELALIVPDAGFLAEESGVQGEQSDYVWVIDPLDGTRNFVKGIPHFCVMVALTYKNEPIVAAVYEPITEKFYYAQQGKGLWLNGVQVTGIDRNCQTTGAIVVGDLAQVPDIKLKLKENNIQVSKRYFGCAGIDAVYLATGTIDLIIFQDIAWWDVAAGILLIQEAGGLICTYQKSAKKQGFGMLHAGNQQFFGKNV